VKKPSLMIAEGSVLLAAQPLRGGVRDIAPEGFPHPVLRAGYAVSVPLPVVQPERPTTTVPAA
jgi:hypothetical protein